MEGLRTDYEGIADCLWRGCGLLMGRLRTTYGEVSDNI